MTLQSSGAISLGNVNVELGRSSTATISLGETAVRTLAGVSSGAIALSNLYGKSNASFTPAGGTSSGSPEVITVYGFTGADASISCTTNATWTYTQSGSPAGYASISSGTSATSISFNLTTDEGSPKATTWNVTGVAGGLTRYWTVELICEAF